LESPGIEAKTLPETSTEKSKISVADSDGEPGQPDGKNPKNTASPGEVPSVTDAANPAAINSAKVMATQIKPAACRKTFKRKGETDMLSEGNPYGKKPPLPEEVMEAVRHLKLLSSPKTVPEYSAAQQEELKEKLGKIRPEWANCLTLQKTLDVADPETEKFINELMDQPIYQESIFYTYSSLFIHVFR
jgi:hypothetical protein